MTILRILARVPHPRVSAVDMAMWDPGVASQLSGLGFLMRTGIAGQAVCPRCDGLHLFRRLGDDPSRMVTVCPDVGQVVVPVSYLQEWTIDFRALATWCGLHLGARCEPIEILPGLAWRWDRVEIAGTRRGLVIVRSPSDLTAQAAWARLGLLPRTVLLTLDAVPQTPGISVPFRGFDAGEVLFLGASGSRKGLLTTDPWEIAFKFAAQENRYRLPGRRRRRRFAQSGAGGHPGQPRLDAGRRAAIVFETPAAPSCGTDGPPKFDVVEYAVELSGQVVGDAIRARQCGQRVL